MSATGAQRPGPALARAGGRGSTSPWAGERGFWLALLAIVAVGVLARVLQALLEAPWPPPAIDDQFYFSALPHLLADGHGFINPFQSVLRHVEVATAEHPPLYPVALTPLAVVGLDDPDWQRLTGALFGAGTIVVVALIARRLAGDRAGLLAGALAAAYPVLVAADGALMSESLLGLLVAGSLLAAYRLRDRPTAGRAAVLGALTALAGLTRGESLLLLPLLLLVVVRRPGGVRASVVAVAVAVVVLAPWTIRNWVTFDRPVAIATNSGTAVAGANCAETYSGDKLGGWWPPCLHDHPGNEAVNHDGQLHDGLSYARDHAGRLPVVLAARFGRVWSLYDPFQTPEGRSVRVQKLGVVAFFLMLPFAAWGIVALRRRGEGVWVLLAPALLVSLTALATYGNLRFREPADVALVVLAAVGLDAVWRRRAAA